MSQYACFWDPGSVGTALTDVCPVCGRQYGTPIHPDHLPATIAGFEVEAGIGRGFYSAAYRVKRPNRATRFALKVMPKYLYLPGAEGGAKPDGKDVNFEIEMHERLSVLPAVAKYIDDGEASIELCGQAVDCYWIQMENAEGPTLQELIDRGPSSAKQVGQIALDLLTVLSMLDSLQLHHNDLHARNVVVAEVGHARRLQAIDPSTQIKVIDWGSVGGVSRSLIEKGKMGDATYVAEHVQNLLSAYQRSLQKSADSALNQDSRLAYLLREGMLALGRRDHVRPPSPGDVADVVMTAFNRATTPHYNPAGIESLSAHYNATTLDLSLALKLLVDEDGSMERGISDPSPLVLTGMRGCGKTHLLKSVSWAARLQPRDKAEAQSVDQLVERLAGEPFVGLYQTCDILRSAPTSPRNKLLLLGYSYEALRLLEVVGAGNVGHIQHTELRRLVDVLENNVDWFLPPAIPDSIASIQDAVSRAIYRSPKSGDDSDRRAFEELAIALSSVLDLWNGKRIYFLLDDVSRHITQDEVFPFLRDLLVQNEHYAFKVSAETLTIDLESPGGAPARGDRDFMRFDLGDLVLARLAGSQGASFLGGILDLRAKFAGGHYPAAVKVLGTQTRSQIASRITQTPHSTADNIYWGMGALAGVCTGDIGSVILLYSQIVQEARLGPGDPLPIDPSLQHRVAIRFSESKANLLHQDIDGPQMHRHAREFAKASHDFLLKSTRANRLQEAAEIQLDLGGLSTEEEAEAIRLASGLIQKGVFVLAPSAHRSKSRDATASERKLQLRLMYTKMLGLAALIPLGRRARFELPYKGYGVIEWLRDPDASKLVDTGRSTEGAQPEEEEATPTQDFETIDKITEEPPPPEAQQMAMAFIEQRVEDEDDDFALSCCARELEGLSDIDWSTATYIGAFGFEDRSLGLWSVLQGFCAKPARAMMISYPERGLTDQIEALLSSWGVDYESVPAPEDGSYSVFAQGLLSRVQSGTLVVDTTSLTKPLIYELVRRAISLRGTTLVLHACASSYDPPDTDLEGVLTEIELRNEPDVRGRLDERVTGEKGPFTVETITDQPFDPGASRALVTFVPLKHLRVEQIIRHRSPDVVISIATTNSLGPEAVRSKLGQKLAETFSAATGGETHAVTALDVDGSYRLLRALYKRFALSRGFNFEMALTGSKMQTVAQAMLGWSLPPTGVYYSKPDRYSATQFTHGTDGLRIFQIEAQEAKEESAHA